MILAGGQPIDVSAISGGYPEGSIERGILAILSSSEEKYQYSSINQLHFELKLRRYIIIAAEELYRSYLSFKVFRDSICNPDYWNRMNDGGFSLKAGVRPSDAINDIFVNSSKYGTECATAMVIIYYRALWHVFPKEAFDSLFPKIYLMNWHQIDRLLREVGLMNKTKDYLPGDRRYFINPDVDPLTPEWQGENVIDMGNGLYYGHGIGKHGAATIIAALNRNRRDGADESAYLLDSVGRPNFKNLSDVYDRTVS